MQKGVASLADALDKPAPVLPPAVTQQTAAASSVDILSGKVGTDCCPQALRYPFFLSLSWAALFRVPDAGLPCCEAD